MWLFYISSRATLKETFTETKIRIYTPKRDDKHPRPFHMGVTPPPPRKTNSSDTFLTFVFL